MTTTNCTALAANTCECSRFVFAQLRGPARTRMRRKHAEWVGGVVVVGGGLLSAVDVGGREMSALLQSAEDTAAVIWKPFKSNSTFIKLEAFIIGLSINV